MNDTARERKKRTGLKRFVLVSAAALALSSVGAGILAAEAAASVRHDAQVLVMAGQSFSDTAGHWGAETIRWAVSRGIVDGYEDGTFRPDRSVSASEFLAILLRAHADPSVELARRGELWHEPYFKYAAVMNWPIDRAEADSLYTRGQVARLLAATHGQSLDTEKAVAYVLEHGLAEGKTSKTVQGFMAGDSLTRAEAVQFIYNMGNTRLMPVSATASSRSFAVQGVSLGQSAASVISKLGEPARKDASEYGFEWYVYNKDYANYAQIGLQGGKVVALYTNASTWSSVKAELRPGASAAEAGRILGEPLAYVMKGNTRYMLDSTPADEAGVYDIDGSYVTLYYDKFEGGKIDALLVVDKSVEEGKAGFYGTTNDAVRTAFERTVFDLANAARVKRGLKPLQWNDAIAGTARKHSADMAQKGYFDHVSPSGSDPGDRLKADGIRYAGYAENIAAGQTNAFAAYAGWMNSEGHRRNMLSNNLTHLGVGIFFGGDLHAYYTQNFFTPGK